MKRLSETPPGERAPGSEAGIELLSTLRPLLDGDDAAHPIPEPRAPSRSSRRVAAPRWAVAAALLGLVGVAGAAIVRAGWLRPPAPPPSTHPSVDAPKSRPGRSAGPGTVPTEATAPVPPRPTVDPTGPAASATLAPRPSVDTAGAVPATREPPAPPASARPHAAPPRRAASSQESQLFLRAWSALRTADDPGAARAVLAEYLRRFPHGSLVEEAHGLAIEAASRLHDPEAARLAARYLRRFPRGRYAGLARAALAATP